MTIVYFAVSVVAVVLTLSLITHSITDTIVKSRYTYKQILDLFEYFLQKSYDTIYESDLITYMSSGIQNIPPDQRETIERNFVKQTMMYMGINNIKMFIDFFGSEETIVVNIIQYIRSKINQDGLAKIIQEKTEPEVNPKQ